MGSRYVPPHLRNRSSIATDGSSLDANSSGGSNEVLARRNLADLQLREGDRNPLLSLLEIKTHYGSSTTNATLHNSAEDSGQLGYVILFQNANPRWNEDQVIFAHTNIHLLPGYKTFKAGLGSSPFDANAGESTIIRDNSNEESSPSLDTPKVPEVSLDPAPKIVSRDHIPVFMELRVPRHIFRHFVFHGYFKILDVEFLAPQSQELVDMLRQKWENVHKDTQVLPTRQREATAWKKSLSHEWAVLKLTRLPQADCPDTPEIQMLPDEVQDGRERSGRKSTAFDKRFGMDAENITRPTPTDR